MANPRLKYRYNRLDAADATYPSDGSITPPAITPQGYSPALSPQVGLAVAHVGTGTSGPTVGLGAAGAALAGKLLVVEPDGTCGVQHEGYMYLPYVTGANQPVQGQPVAVDGTGKVQVAAAYTGALCVGFGLDPEPLNETTASLYCIVKK